MHPLQPFRSNFATNNVVLNEKYTELAKQARTDIAGFEALFAGAHADTDQKVFDVFKEKFAAQTTILQQHGDRHGSSYTLKQGGDAKLLDEAKTSYRKLESELKNYLRGEKIEGFEQTVSPALKDAFTKAETSLDAVAKPATGMLGSVRTQGFAVAVKKGAREMNVLNKDVAKGKGFARIGAVGAGGAFMIHGFAKSRDANDEPRSLLARGVEVMAGAALATGGFALGAAR